MKLSAFWKSKGDDTKLITYDDCLKYDQVFISKVFNFTKIPENILKMSHVKYGGSGFFYDDAMFLSHEIEHMMPDYTLYSNISKKLKYYHVASIGFTTRGCFRHCNFCINRNKNKVIK